MLEEENVKLYKWLSPFSLIYGLGVRLRNKLFDWDILRSKSYDIPILSVGNITAVSYTHLTLPTTSRV